MITRKESFDGMRDPRAAQYAAMKRMLADCEQMRDASLVMVLAIPDVRAGDGESVLTQHCGWADKRNYPSMIAEIIRSAPDGLDEHMHEQAVPFWRALVEALKLIEPFQEKLDKGVGQA